MQVAALRAQKKIKKAARKEAKKEAKAGRRNLKPGASTHPHFGMT
jgi:hypothetical protein